MELLIDTTKKDAVILRLSDNGKKIAVIEQKAVYTQAEKLLPALKNMLKKNKLGLNDIKEIKVDNDGGTFTSLRIGVVTANALAFALKVPLKVKNGQILNKKGLKIAKPIYNAPPKIG